jgi:hypothetical protein
MMKTKNCRVRVDQIKNGVRVFTSHPVYGIDERKVIGKPFISKYGKSLFVKCYTKYGEDDFSLMDAGITAGNSYNYRRTFFKRKQAEEWAAKMKTDPGFLRQQAYHEAQCKKMDWMGML